MPRIVFEHPAAGFVLPLITEMDLVNFTSCILSRYRLKVDSLYKRVHFMFVYRIGGDRKIMILSSLYHLCRWIYIYPHGIRLRIGKDRTLSTTLQWLLVNNLTTKTGSMSLEIVRFWVEHCEELSWVSFLTWFVWFLCCLLILITLLCLEYPFSSSSAK